MRDRSAGTPIPTGELGAPAGRAFDGAGIETLEDGGDDEDSDHCGDHHGTEGDNNGEGH